MNEQRKDDGGPAYPCGPGGLSTTGDDGYTRHQFPGSDGMSLRDYFAAAVVQSIVRSQNNRFNPDDDAAWAYRVADAMIAERDK